MVRAAMKSVTTNFHSVDAIVDVFASERTDSQPSDPDLAEELTSYKQCYCDAVPSTTTLHRPEFQLLPLRLSGCRLIRLAQGAIKLCSNHGWYATSAHVPFKNHFRKAAIIRRIVKLLYRGCSSTLLTFVVLYFEVQCC